MQSDGVGWREQRERGKVIEEEERGEGVSSTRRGHLGLGFDAPRCLLLITSLRE
jgi:hypothetical protein